MSATMNNLDFASEVITYCATPKAFNKRVAEGKLGIFAAAFVKGVIRRLERSVRENPTALKLLKSRLIPMEGQIPINAEAWIPEIGAAYQRITAGLELEAVIHALMGLHSLRITGEWSVELESRIRLSIGGNIFMSPCSMRVISTGTDITVIDQESPNDHLTFAYKVGGWECSSEKTVEKQWGFTKPILVPEKRMQVKYLQAWFNEPSDNVIDFIVDWPPGKQQGYAKTLPEVAAKQIAQSLNILDAAGSTYVPWIIPLLRGLATSPITSEEIRNSSSYIWHPGVILSGFPSPLDYVCEVLVHEVSHQHYLLLSTVLRLVNIDNKKMYYSALKRMSRTVDKVLLAFHATGNMVILWKDIIENCSGSTEDFKKRSKQLSLLEKQMKSLYSELIKADSFTDAGSRFFQTQVAVLNEYGSNLNAN